MTPAVDLKSDGVLSPKAMIFKEALRRFLLQCMATTQVQAFIRHLYTTGPSYKFAESQETYGEPGEHTSGGYHIS